MTTIDSVPRWKFWHHVPVVTTRDPDAPVTVAENDQRWTRWLRNFVIFLVADFIITVSLFLFTDHALSQTNHNAKVQRAGQLVTCQADNTKALAIQTFDTYTIKKENSSLAQTQELLPTLATKEVIELEIATIKTDIAAYTAELKAFPVLDCQKLYG